MTAEEEATLIQEWLDTVEFDIEMGGGLPELDPEDDDED